MRISIPHGPFFALVVLAASLSLLAATGCSDDDTEQRDAGTEDTKQTTEDADRDVGDGPDISDEHVDIDLESYLEDAPDPEGSAEVFEATDPSELVEGTAATGRVGDWVLKNEHVRFVVEQDDRNVGVCPWGGNIIDAEARSADAGGDILGEICLFLNVDQTFRAETYEVVDHPEAAVLAVTGSTALLDYFNIRTMASDISPFLPDLLELIPDELLEMTITQYHILRPGDRGVRTVAAMRNDSEEPLDLVVSHMMVNGADGTHFNPLSELGGFGYERTGLTDPDPDPLPFLSLVADDSSVAYVPEPHDDLEADLPTAGGYLTIFNVVAAFLGEMEILDLLMTPEDQLSDRESVVSLDPGDVETIEHWTYAGDGSPATLANVAYDQLDVDTGTIEGRVVDENHEAVDAIPVSAIDNQGRTMNQDVTDTDGDYQMRVPAGDYDLEARDERYLTDTPVSADVEAGQTTSVDDVATIPLGSLEVTVETPAGDPTPARVTIVCPDQCPDKPSSNLQDVTTDGLADEFAAIGWAGVDGTASIPVPAGDYEVVVSRGIEWSVWPSATFEQGGELVEVTAGEPTDVDAEIAPVVNTDGTLSGDFHIHTISSLDSTTPKRDRVLTFLTEGVDVMVSSDHDTIADYGPAVDALGAGDQITSLVGNEITTIDLGHFNGFPLMLDEAHRRGGAFDWAGGEQLAHPPAASYDWIRESPGEQVVQLNHPDSSYLQFSDVVRGISYGDPDVLRVQMPDYDDQTGQTGLWSEDFTAMELMNGHEYDRFNGVARWWLTLLGRGHKSTGTAVTDTHTRYNRVLGGVPRTYVSVDEDRDTIPEFDTQHFVESVNDGAAIGTNGPFVRLEATNDAGQTVGLGETVETRDEPVEFELTVEVPTWIEVDTIEMIKNSEDVVTDPGEYDTEPIEPTETFDVELTDADRDIVAEGDEQHRRYRTTVDIDVETDEDAYVVFFVRGSGDMYPIVGDDTAAPFAFTNPVFLDSDGDGYSEPHLQELAESDPPESHPTLLQLRDDEDDPLEGKTREEILHYLEHHHDELDHGHQH